SHIDCRRARGHGLLHHKVEHYNIFVPNQLTERVARTLDHHPPIRPPPQGATYPTCAKLKTACKQTCLTVPTTEVSQLTGAPKTPAWAGVDWRGRPATHRTSARAAIHPNVLLPAMRYITNLSQGWPSKCHPIAT